MWRETVSTMVLVPRVVDSVAPTPVVAAGGIADGRGLAAALALGGDAAVLGTRLLATTESNAHELYKKKILAASKEETVHTSLFGNGWPNAPHRMLRTPSVEKWLEDEKRGSEQRPEEPLIGEVTFGGMRTPLPRFGGISPSEGRHWRNPTKTRHGLGSGIVTSRSVSNALDGAMFRSPQSPNDEDGPHTHPR